MPRRFHSKSRFRCVACKRRSVKICDERQPICGGYSRLRSECSYEDPRTPPIPTAESPGQDQVAATMAECDSTSQTQLGFDLLDLTLMHHYTTRTSQHLFTGEEHIRVWQYHIPAVAASNVVLMHCILSVTALHRACEDSQNCDLYRVRALHHHPSIPPETRAAIAASLLSGFLLGVAASNFEISDEWNKLLPAWAATDARAKSVHAD